MRTMPTEGLIHSTGGRIFLLLTWAFLCSLIALACLTARTALLPVLRAIFPGMSVKHGAGWWALVLFGFWLSGPILLAARWFVAPPVTAFLMVVQQFWWVPLMLAGLALVGLVARVLWRHRPDDIAAAMRAHGMDPESRASAVAAMDAVQLPEARRVGWSLPEGVGQWDQ